MDVHMYIGCMRNKNLFEEKMKTQQWQRKIIRENVHYEYVWLSNINKFGYDSIRIRVCSFDNPKKIQIIKKINTKKICLKTRNLSENS